MRPRNDGVAHALRSFRLGAANEESGEPPTEVVLASCNRLLASGEPGRSKLARDGRMNYATTEDDRVSAAPEAPLSRDISLAVSFPVSSWRDLRAA